MASPTAAEAARTRGIVHSEIFPVAMLLAGFLLRLRLAHFTFLNPDEALHYLLSVQPSAALAYKASLTTVHPPLFILWLHYWGLFGHSEFLLRLPCVLAGTAFCWIVYRWLTVALNRAAGIIALALLLFLPPLIFVSAELRQYAFLLFFMAASVYLFDRACSPDSTSAMLGSGFFLCLALLTHYSAFLFAAAFAVYALVRFTSRNAPRRLLAAWIVTMLVAAALWAFLWTSHVSHLAVRGVLHGMAEGWFRQAIFQPGESVLRFALKASLRFFHYLFWSGAIGAIGLLLFIVGVVQLLRNRESSSQNPARPTTRQLGIFLTLPFLINLATAFAGKYPLGGTRHNAFLAMFAIAGISVPLARWSAFRRWSIAAGIAAALAIVNFFPSPSGTYIRPEFQSRKLMKQATDFLAQSLPPGSTILADQESALLLSYYFCHSPVVQIEPSLRPLHKFSCGDKWVITTFPRWFIFDGQTLPTALKQIAGMGSGPAGTLWFFQAGWLVEKEPEIRKVLTQHNCSMPGNFGQNILICELTASPNSAQ
ncbi:MAG TPA: glycosyltransferase family 39 protein [Terriglobales bacterium]|nr:glycosyltransferase family 39 protein [Terriglobales bacterium]